MSMLLVGDDVGRLKLFKYPSIVSDVSRCISSMYPGMFLDCACLSRPLITHTPAMLLTSQARVSAQMTVWC